MTDWKTEIQRMEGWTFGDSPQMADDLARQASEGKNLGNCFLWSETILIPKMGDRSYIKDSEGRPICVVEVSDVHILPFADVTQAFANVEGYKTIEEWQKVHRSFFIRRFPKFTDKTIVVCQLFKLIHVF